MGQKTNPTLLRLEKTNQHYKASWFSDRFYAEQLHHNYKSLNYLEKTFYKVKKTKTINYIKAGYNYNQLFCLLPKKRQKRFKFGKSKFYACRSPSVMADMKNSTTSKALLNRFYLFYILPNKGKLINNNNYINNTVTPMPSALPKVIQSLVSISDSKIKQVSPLENNLKSKTKVNFLSWYKQHYKQKQELCFSVQNKARQLTRNLYRLNNFHEKGKVATISKLNQSLLHNQLNLVPSYLDITKQINQVKKHHRVRMERVLGASSDLTFIRQNLLNLETIDKVNNQKTSFIKQDKKLSKLQWLHHISNSRNITLSHKTTSINFVKISHLQQSSQFLAQKIMVGLSNRINFPRLRKQILWDVTKSKFVKGIKVTLSGRVESKSKKAQKARDRTFQWGQTELHVLSSLVNFTQSNLVTPFGKIGIKVWVCYGI